MLCEEHQFDSTYRIEIPQAIGEVPDTRCRSAAEERLETPLSFIEMIRGRDDVLKLMLHVVNFFDNRFVFVIESDVGEVLSRVWARLEKDCIDYGPEWTPYDAESDVALVGQ